jgi:hypothetical protein
MQIAKDTIRYRQENPATLARARPALEMEDLGYQNCRKKIRKE